MSSSAIQPDSPAIDLTQVDQIVARLGTGSDHCIPILQAIHDQYNYLPREALDRVCQITEITPAQIMSVATFYNQFRHTPSGKHTLRICHGTACHVKGSELIKDAIRRQLLIPADKDTDPSGLFTIHRVGCVGCCTLAPVAQIDTVTYGHQAPHTAGGIVHDFLTGGGGSNGKEEHDDQLAAGDMEIRVGLGSCCVAGGGRKVRDALADAIHAENAGVSLKSVACIGMCHQTPLVEVMVKGQRQSLYRKVDEDDARWIVRRHFKPRGIFAKVRSTVSSWIDQLLAEPPSLDRKSLDARMAHCASSSAPRCAWPLSITGTSRPWRSTSTSDSRVSRPCASASALKAKRSSRRSRIPACAAGAARVFPADENGRLSVRRKATSSTSSATAMKATPARSWTACCWSRSPIACSRAWPSPRWPSARSRDISTSARSIRWRSSASTRPSGAPRRRATWARMSWAPAGASSWKSATAPAPLCAARRRR